MKHDRDPSAYINIARRVMSTAGWGRYKPTKPSDMRNSGEIPLSDS